MTDAFEIIKEYAPTFTPRVGLILGSGSSGMVAHIDDPIDIPYEELPGFFTCSVEGHTGRLILGTIKGTPVACLSGRTHYYEGATLSELRTPIYTLKALGCDYLISTNATGAILILVSLLHDFNLSSFVIEIAWLLISLYGLTRWLRDRNSAGSTA